MAPGSCARAPVSFDVTRLPSSTSTLVVYLVVQVSVGSFPLTVTVTTMGYISYKNPVNKALLRTVAGRGNDPRFQALEFKL